MDSRTKAMFFLTEIDPRAAVKGSRDPLGLQPLWTRFGRTLVGNLTTVTTSVRGFTTFLLGLHFAEEAVGSGRRSEEERIALFLKFEQLAAYSRFAYHGRDTDVAEGLRGLRRVKRRLGEGGRGFISAEREHQILSNQKTYGLWGLYTIAARQSGLCDREESRLSPLAREFVARAYLPRLTYAGRPGSEILAFLEKDHWFEPRGKDRQLGSALAEILKPTLTADEREIYGRSLVLGIQPGCDHTSGRQRNLWEILETVNGGTGFGWNEPFDYRELTMAHERSRGRGEGLLEACLDHVRVVEPFLAAAARLFSFLLNRNDARLSDVAAEIRATWSSGLEHLRLADLEALQPRIAEVSGRESSERLLGLAGALYRGEYEEAIQTAMLHNSAVMRERDGTAWLSVEQGRLQVRLRDEAGRLPARGELPELWINTYFLNSLKRVGATVFGKIV